MDKLETALGHWVILLSIVLIGLAATGSKYLYFTNNYRIFFSKENPQLLAFEALENTYTKNDSVIIVLEPINGNVFTRETLSIVEKLTEQSWQVPYSSRVDSITNFQYTEADADDLIVRDLVKNANNLSNEELEKIKKISLSEPLLYKRLISDRAHVTAVNVTVQLPRVNETTETPEVVNFIRKMTETVSAEHPDINIYLSGNVMLDNAFSEASITDLKTLIPVSFALLINLQPVSRQLQKLLPHRNF